MATRTFVAISMLASLTLLAPASQASGHGSGGRGGGSHGASHGGGSSSGGHAGSSSGVGHGSSFGTSHGASVSTHAASFSTQVNGSGGFTSHAAGFESNGHASFRDSSTSAGGDTMYGRSSGEIDSGRVTVGGTNPYATSTYAAPHPAVLHTVNHGHADVAGGGPVHVTGRVRGHNPSFTFRGEAVERGWTARYQFRVPGMYRTYFTPYTAYVDATYWVTDWVITDTLVSEEIVMEGPSDVGSPAMDVVVKEELREEIVADLQAPEETEASADDPRIRAALANPSHIFLVSNNLAVQNSKGFACALRAADMVRPLSRVAPGDGNVSVVVLAAKGGECAPGQQVTLTAADLAEFERSLLTRVDHARAALQG